ncbi:MAG TPA: DMT family transporter, partial [Rhodanobacter sp.]|nr:DMT family transporter [Rhodanobacter sp.]
PQALAAASWPHVSALLWLGIAPSFVGYLAWNVAVDSASASRVSSFIYLSPPIALLIGWLWLREVPNALILVGGAITIGGVVLANARRRAASALAAISEPT